jgi:ADP-heptose:LPS heptosyltransferase
MRGHPALDELMVYNTAFGPQKWTIADLTRHLQILRWARMRKFDLAINLQPGKRSEVVTRWTGAKCRVGFERSGQNESDYTVKVKDIWDERYRADQMLDTIRAVGIEAEVELPAIGLSEEDRRSVRAYADGIEGPLVVMHAPSSMPEKLWPRERFAELADTLVSRYGARIAYTGSKSESEYVDSIISMMHSPCVSVAGKLNLRQLAALIERADLLIGVDSCPTHIASAVGTPSITLFGPSPPEVWNPPGGLHVAIRKLPGDCDCRPPHCNPRDSRCMENIGADDVLTHVEKILSK